MNAHDILFYGDRFLMGCLDGIPESDWDTQGVCGWWSVKNIMSHLTSYEHLLIEVLSGFVDPIPTPYLEEMGADPGAFNDHQVEMRSGKTPKEVLAEYHENYRRALDLVQKISPEKLREPGTIPWYGLEYSLDDYIVYSFYGHKREHGAQVNVFKDTLKK
jgi:hypothetical protein